MLEIDMIREMQIMLEIRKLILMKMKQKWKRMLEMNVIVKVKMIPAMEMIWSGDDDA